MCLTENEHSYNEEDLYFYYSATLRIFANTLDTDCISSNLDLQPTHVHRKGEPRLKNKREPIWEHDAWLYTVQLPKEEPLDLHIQTLWDLLKPYKDYIIILKEKAEVDIFCGYRSNSGTAGFEVSPASLEMFIQLDIPFGVSVIIT